MSVFQSESEMLETFLRSIERLGLVCPDDIVAPEFRWMGRRVDVATLSTKTGVTRAYELKLSNNFKAADQASLNKLAFDRSYVVTATPPSEAVLGFAQEVGVGVMLLGRGAVDICLESTDTDLDEHIHAKLLERLGSWRPRQESNPQPPD